MKIYAIPKVQDILKAFAFRNKYDMLSGEAVRQILKEIKEYQTDKSFFIMVNGTKIDVEIKKDASMMTEPYNEYPFKITAFTEKSTDINPEIVIAIILNNDFSSKNYGQINNSLYGVLRHEFEHIDDLANEGLKCSPEQKSLYEKLMKEDNPYATKEKMVEHIRNISKYILSDEEIFAYVRSIVYVAKKQDRNAADIIDMTLNRSFYNNKSENLLLVKDDMEVQKIVKETKERLMKEISRLYPPMRTFPYTAP